DALTTPSRRPQRLAPQQLHLVRELRVREPAEPRQGAALARVEAAGSDVRVLRLDQQRPAPARGGRYSDIITS
ncbi:MAG: hypothetical protein KC468_30920, partial [Myxococcales bacterium]|nr:hypothetical protein [Myxococcales bacterium]